MTIECLPHQGKLLQAPYLFNEIRFFFEVCGYAAGKTSSLVYGVLRAVDYFSGHRDLEGKKPKLVVAGITLTFLKKTFSGALINFLDLSGTPYNWNKADNIIEICGVQIFLLPIEDSSVIFGYDVACVFVDELDELPSDMAMQIVKKLNDRARQPVKDCRSPFICFATTSQGLKGTYQTIQEFIQKDISYMLIRGSTKDNKYLLPEWVETMYKIYDERQTRCYLEGEFIAVDSGLVLPQYNHAKHFLHGIDLWNCLPDKQKVYIGQDFNQGSGFNKATAATVIDGVIYFIKEYEFPDWTTAPKVFRSDFPNQEIWWVPDMTYAQNFGMAGKSLRAYDIKIAYKKANPLVSDRVVVMNALLHSGRMYVCDFCRDTDKACMMYQFDKKTGQPMKGKTEKAPDHLIDCMGYVTYYIVSNESVMKDLFDVTINRFKRKRDELGYMELNGMTTRMHEIGNRMKQDPA
jgi:hypothetical protein